MGVIDIIYDNPGHIFLSIVVFIFIVLILKTYLTKESFSSRVEGFVGELAEFNSELDEHKTKLDAVVGDVVPELTPMQTPTPIENELVGINMLGGDDYSTYE